MPCSVWTGGQDAAARLTQQDQDGSAATPGLFARLNWSDDKTGTYAFTEIGRSASAGGLLTAMARDTVPRTYLK